MLFLGNASGHDFQFHVASWMDAAGQWREGIAYPRWAEWANWGFGEPRFIFYPPASWMAGAALGSVLPWRAVPGALIWLTLIAAGMAMWSFAREWLPGPQATVAALLYAVNPYNLVIVYYRSDFAELMAWALVPLLLRAALRVAAGEWRRVPIFAAVFGGIWLTNAPAAVIATYSLGLVVVIECARRRGVGPLVRGAIAMAAGFGLAAFYILPAAWEQRWVQIAQVVAEELRPEVNFLFTRENDPDFMAFNWKVSWVAIALIVVIAVAACFIARDRKKYQTSWWTLTALGVSSAALMLRPTLWIWEKLPELRFVQFPWRWLGVLSLVFAFLVAAAAGRVRNRLASWTIITVVFAAIAAAGATMIKDAWWDNADVPAMAAAISSGNGYEGTDEYAPVGCNRYYLPGNKDDSERPAGVSPISSSRFAKLDPESGDLVPASGVRLHVEEWSAERKAFAAESVAPVTLAVRLVDYPAWEVQMNGQRVSVDLRAVTKQILLPLSPGSNRVEINFRRTWDRNVGDAISVLTAIALMPFAWMFRNRSNRPLYFGRKQESSET
jgi:hypothetical protein